MARETEEVHCVVEILSELPYAVGIVRSVEPCRRGLGVVSDEELLTRAKEQTKLEGRELALLLQESEDLSEDPAVRCSARGAIGGALGHDLRPEALQVIDQELAPRSCLRLNAGMGLDSSRHHEEDRGRLLEQPHEGDLVPLHLLRTM